MSYSVKQIFVSGGIIFLIVGAILLISSLHIDLRIKIVVYSVLFLGAVYFIKRMKNFATGDIAEMVVENILRDLPKEFKGFRNIVIGNRGNIDNVIVGPTGIWVVEVKGHQGRIGFNGEVLTRWYSPFEKNFLNQAWHETFTLRDFLKEKTGKEFKIQPVIVFAGKYVSLNFGMRPVKGVYVVGKSWVNNLIFSSKAQVLDVTIQDRVVSALKELKNNG